MMRMVILQITMRTKINASVQTNRLINTNSVMDTITQVHLQLHYTVITVALIITIQVIAENQD